MRINNDEKEKIRKHKISIVCQTSLDQNLVHPLRDQNHHKQEVVMISLNWYQSSPK